MAARAIQNDLKQSYRFAAARVYFSYLLCKYAAQTREAINNSFIIK